MAWRMKTTFPICTICKKEFINVCVPCTSKKLHDRLDNTVNRQNGCTSCGGFWKDCPVCAKMAIRVDSAVERKPGTRLKLFRVVIRGQTVRSKNSSSLKRKLKIGEITENGWLEGREIIVLGTGRNRIYDQCLEELGCMEGEVDMVVTEMEGPFEHGTVISYKMVPIG